jgi:UDP-N-acetyl-alpha-D-quinovosamine dehydrogenase
VLLTGASGFVGRALAVALARADYEVRLALRGTGSGVAGTGEQVYVGDICATTDWREALRGVDGVIHSAARAHRMNDHDSAAYIRTNTEGTTRLASQAAECGVKRLVFLSSIKVNGEETDGHAYTPADEPRPQDAYGESKLLAETSLNEIARRTGMQAVIVRLPLVYGPGVRANFLRLMRWVDRGWPLPLGCVRNRRSLVSIWNLCDLLVNVVGNPAVNQGTWMVSDGDDLSTPELIRRLAAAMHRPARLLPVPMALLGAIAALTGRSAELRRLCGSLAVDISRTRAQLGWSPPMSIDEGLSRTAAWYMAEGRI